MLGILEVDGCCRPDSETSTLESFGLDVAIDSILEEALRGIERDVFLLCKLLYIRFSLAFWAIRPTLTDFYVLNS